MPMETLVRDMARPVPHHSLEIPLRIGRQWPEVQILSPRPGIQPLASIQLSLTQQRRRLRPARLPHRADTGNDQ